MDSGVNGELRDQDDKYCLELGLSTHVYLESLRLIPSRIELEGNCLKSILYLSTPLR